MTSSWSKSLWMSIQNIESSRISRFKLWVPSQWTFKILSNVPHELFPLFIPCEHSHNGELLPFRRNYYILLQQLRANIATLSPLYIKGHANNCTGYTRDPKMPLLTPYSFLPSYSNTLCSLNYTYLKRLPFHIHLPPLHSP